MLEPGLVWRVNSGLPDVIYTGVLLDRAMLEVEGIELTARQNIKVSDCSNGGKEEEEEEEERRGKSWTFGKLLLHVSQQCECKVQADIDHYHPHGWTIKKY